MYASIVQSLLVAGLVIESTSLAITIKVIYTKKLNLNTTIYQKSLPKSITTSSKLMSVNLR